MPQAPRCHLFQVKSTHIAYFAYSSVALPFVGPCLSFHLKHDESIIRHVFPLLGHGPLPCGAKTGVTHGGLMLNGGFPIQIFFAIHYVNL